MKRRISVFTSLLLVFSLVIQPVLAYDYGSVNSFSKVRFYGIETSNHNLSGTYTIIDSVEFLSLVTAAMSLNDGFRVWTNQDVYQVLNARFNDSTSQDFMVLTFRPGEYQYTPNVKNAWFGSGQNEVNVNGILLDPANYTAFNLYHSNCMFDDYLTVTNVGGFGYDLDVAKNDADRVLCFDVGTQPVMANILSNLTSISNSVASINSYCSNISYNSQMLSSIYSAVNQCATELYSIDSKLTSISTTLSTISNNISLTYSRLGDTNTYLDSIESYISDSFPIFEDDLDQLVSDLQTFSYNFSVYSSQVISQLQHTNDTLDDMSQTLTGIEDLMNGESLKTVPVSGTNFNLWGLIKTGVSTALVGLGNFFNLIFDSITLFATSGAAGFQELRDVDQFTSIPYSPTYLSFNLVPPLQIRDYNATGFSMSVTNGNIHCSAPGENTNLTRTSINLNPTFTLEPGDYVVYYGVSYTPVGVQIRSSDTVICSNDTSTESRFSLSESKSITIRIRARRDMEYSVDFYPVISKIE